MRITNLHTICILALGSILAIGIEAHAQLDPNMEASAGCFEANCVFEGNSRPSDNLRGLSKIPVEPKLIKVAEYADNRSFVIDQKSAPQFNLVGELNSVSVVDSGRVGVSTTGSATLVSPCTIVTSFHVALGTDVVPVPGKTYSMTFSAGKGQDQGAFAGHTKATAVLWKETDHENHDGLVLMKLDKCVGTLSNFGWAELAASSAASMVQRHEQIGVAGYTTLDQRGALHLGRGEIKGIDASTGMVEHSGSMYTHSSGGGLFSIESGKMVLAGVNVGDVSQKFAEGSATQATWTRSNTGLAIPISELTSWKDGMNWIEADKRAWGQANPAVERLASRLPSRPERLASLQ